MYTNLGYIVYRTVLEYYSGDPDEDAFGEFVLPFLFKYSTTDNATTVDLPTHQLDPKSTIPFNFLLFLSDMRKSMSRDEYKSSMIPLQHPVRCEDVE